MQTLTKTNVYACFQSHRWQNSASLQLWHRSAVFNSGNWKYPEIASNWRMHCKNMILYWKHQQQKNHFEDQVLSKNVKTLFVIELSDRQSVAVYPFQATFSLSTDQNLTGVVIFWHVKIHHIYKLYANEFHLFSRSESVYSVLPLLVVFAFAINNKT